MHDELPRFPLQLGQGLPDGLEQRLLAVAADVVDVVGLDGVESHAAEVSQERVLGLDLQAGRVVEGHPEAVAAEAVRAGQVLVAFDRPVSALQGLANLLAEKETQNQK